MGARWPKTPGSSTTSSRSRKGWSGSSATTATCLSRAICSGMPSREIRRSGTRFLTYVELAAQWEQAQRQAEQAQRQAEEEKQAREQAERKGQRQEELVQRLLAQMKALGVKPDIDNGGEVPTQG